MKYLFCKIYILLTIFLLSAGVVVAKGKDDLKKKKEIYSQEEQQLFSDYFFQAQKEKILGNYENAISFYQKALQIKSNEDAILYELARLFLSERNDLPIAKEYIEKAISIADKNIWYYVLYSEILQRMEQYSKSADVYNKITAMSPHNLTYYYDWATKLIYAQRLNDAVKVYDKIESITGMSAELSLQKQKIYMNLGKRDKAIQELKKLSDHYPTDMQYKGMLGELYMSFKDIEKAKDIFEEILEIEPHNGYALINLADYYQQKKNLDKFRFYIVESFKANEIDIDSKMKILLDMYVRSQNDSVLNQIVLDLGLIMVQNYPNDPKSYSILGDIYNKEGNKIKARENFEKVLTFDESKYPVWEELFFIYLELDDYNSLLEKTSKAIELFPLQPLGYLFNGVAYFHKKEYEQAAKILKSGRAYVVENDALLAEFYANLGDVYHAMGNQDMSDENYENSLKHKPDNVGVLNNYSYYLALRNQNIEKALAMSLKANQLSPNNPAFEDTLGWIFFIKGDYDNALQWIKRAIEHGADKDESVLDHYGDVLFKKGKYNDAKLFWQRAIENGGDQKIIQQKIENIK